MCCVVLKIGYNSKIEPTSIVATGYTWFVLIGYLLVVLLVLVIIITRAKKLIQELLIPSVEVSQFN